MGQTLSILTHEAVRHQDDRYLQGLLVSCSCILGQFNLTVKLTARCVQIHAVLASLFNKQGSHGAVSQAGWASTLHEM